MTSPSPATESTPLTMGGRVEIDLHWGGGRILDCRIASRRPNAARLLAGRTADEVLALVPRLFSLCGQAQQAVAGAALASAAGLERPAVDGLCNRLRREAIGEHLWRLMLDWPEHLQEKQERATFALFYRRLRAAAPDPGLAAALASASGPELIAPLLAALASRESGLAPAPAPEMPALLPGLDPALADQLFAHADAAFAGAPVWRGRACEVGALARFAEHPEVLADWRAGRPLSARLRARWLALQAEIAALDRAEAHKAIDQVVEASATAVSAVSAISDASVVASAAAGPGVGIAWVETARGPLCHRVQLDAGRVLDYVVIAPTEWNFHPQSEWLAGLIGGRAESAAIAENRLRLWALALDPCVPIHLTVTEEN